MNWKIFGATLRGLLLRHFPFITPFSISRSICLLSVSLGVETGTQNEGSDAHRQGPAARKQAC